MWAVATRCKAEDIDVIRGLWTQPVDPMMDPADRNRNLIVNSRLIINACRPWERIKEFPPVNKFSPDYRDQILKQWSKIF